MSDTLDNVRKRLEVVIHEAAANVEAERFHREQQLARAMENLNQESACQAAYREGRRDERYRCQCLIDDHLSTLQRGGISALALESLRETVGKG
jgi:hypothetical protein